VVSDTVRVIEIGVAIFPAPLLGVMVYAVPAGIAVGLPVMRQYVFVDPTLVVSSVSPVGREGFTEQPVKGEPPVHVRTLAVISDPEEVWTG